MSVDWGTEPDIQAFSRANSLLVSDPSTGLAELERLAEAGSLMSMYVLGETFRNGTLGYVDLTKAEEWYRMAADRGQVRAAYALGWLYGNRGDAAAAINMYERGARNGYAPAMNALALMYFYGQGTDRNLDLARSWWEVGVSKGHGLSKIALGAHFAKGKYGSSRILRGIFLIISAFFELPLIYFKDKFSDKLR